MTSSILFYTPAAQRDYLGHWIIRASHGTWSHVAIKRDYEPASADLPLDVSEVIEAVPPSIHRLQGEVAQRAIVGARAAYAVQAHSAGQEHDAWGWLESQIGKGYSYGTIVTDLIANLFGLRSVVKLPGTQVCSSLAAIYVRLTGDQIIPPATDLDLLTPADLGELLLKQRAPRPHGSQ